MARGPGGSSQKNWVRGLQPASQNSYPRKRVFADGFDDNDEKVASS